ncbi:ZIP zinc transporter [Vairimorpha necatrix]|uniref:ZIP zinc transporter n=1 Tax=Vairimorpha necatrix TaxID=6039 RepID=A0AAX4JAA8_9MICR
MVKTYLNTFLQDYYGFEVGIFCLSFLFCLIPKAIKSVNRLTKIFPILTLSSAGFLLAVLLLDFIPHMFPHEHHNHSHEKHEHHSHGDINTTVGMICAGLSLLCLIAIDQCVIKHDHCEDNQEHDHHEHNHNEENIGCCNTEMLQKTESKTKALIYIASISIHSFFEGLAIKPRDLGSYELGIVLHKILESFAIGMTLFNSAFSFPVCLLMNAFYSILTPIGMVISRNAAGNIYKIFDVPINFIFNGLALGSLIFIVFLEMIPGAFHKKGNKAYKMLGLILGFVLSSILIVMTPHEH